MAISRTGKFYGNPQPNHMVYEGLNRHGIKNQLS